ncbi:unnamed protein product [Protopolystoma xenopodis]|uniref:Protein kinase domain-containing protein n=1 Tax=Protopolystoma xenopodis TaxID=117903 RepID=A0A448X9I2_9PLAT|nr:unnamed protein product [Protopolystoma xenopodis]
MCFHNQVFIRVPEVVVRPEHPVHYKLPFDKDWELPRSCLRIGEKLGEGAFGVVYLGVIIKPRKTPQTPVFLNKPYRQLRERLQRPTIKFEEEQKCDISFFQPNQKAKLSKYVPLGDGRASFDLDDNILQ